ncbi:MULTISPECIES: response regulator [Paenibacillus]|uniref:DNA-binding response regulator n=1 Tax=Paenibacillus lautus TaxID=1401 RepID=A0A1R1AT93_PAELA|nr:response regulator [Paenibacillus lautus]OME88801.1 DNA-binding response regulator [Paenibacillus lautus]
MRVLIVDDEQHVREAIGLLADWERHGITEIDQAADGEEAVRLIEENKPQIVMTDMRMPRKNGLELLTWLHNTKPDIKVLVISGYDDFEYVRHTIRSGGIDYILKPVEPDSLNEALTKAVQTWQLEEEKRQQITNQNIEMNQMTPFYMDRLLSDLVNGYGNKDSVVSQLRNRMTLPVTSMVYNVAVLRDDQFDEALLSKFRNRRHLLSFTLINICNELLMDQGVAFRHIDKPGEIIILCWNPRLPFNDVLDRINDGFFSTLRRRSHFGAAKAGAFPDDLPKAYLNAVQALYSRNLLTGKCRIHRERAVESEASRTLRLSSYEEKFKLAALSGSKERIETATEEWLQDVRERDLVSPEHLARWNSEWDWIQYHWTENEVNSTQEPVEDAEISQDLPFPLPYSEDGMICWDRWREQISGRLYAASRVLTQIHSKDNHIIHDIARYLEQHYHEEISLQQIAGKFFLSREYISRKFKQEFGVTLSDFLGRIRIDKAKTLLLNPQIRIAQIAEMVGYQDEKYFSKVFKKMEGVTPNEYRKKHMS